NGGELKMLQRWLRTSLKRTFRGSEARFSGCHDLPATSRSAGYRRRAYTLQAVETQITDSIVPRLHNSPPREASVRLMTYAALPGNWIWRPGSRGIMSLVSARGRRSPIGWNAHVVLFRQPEAQTDLVTACASCHGELVRRDRGERLCGRRKPSGRKRS